MPAVWQQAAPVVIRGAALVAAGVIAEFLLRSAAKKAVSMPFGGTAKKSRAVARRAAPKTIAYTFLQIIKARVMTVFRGHTKRPARESRHIPFDGKCGIKYLYNRLLPHVKLPS